MCDVTPVMLRTRAACSAFSATATVAGPLTAASCNALLSLDRRQHGLAVPK